MKATLVKRHQAPLATRSLVALLLVVGAALVPHGESAEVRARQNGQTVEVENGRVKVRCVQLAERVTQQFFARRDSNWVLVAESFAPGDQFEKARRGGVVFDDFESGYGQWTAQGQSFGPAPAEGAFPGQQTVTGYGGKRLANSWRGDDNLTGRLVSKPFTVERAFVCFKIGGGRKPGQACLNLVVDGKAVRTATGADEERLRPTAWNVSEFRGQTARFEIVDEATGGWGHVNVDDIAFGDRAPEDDLVALFDASVTPHRYLTAAQPARMRLLPSAAADEATVELRSQQGGAVIVETIRLRRDATHLNVDVQADLPGSPAKLDYLLSTYSFNLDRAPAFIHTPGQKFDDPRAGPGRDQVTGDRAFHAPAVILQEGGLFAALVPDLESINRDKVVSPDARRTMKIARNIFSVPVEADKYTMPTGLDLNLRTGLTRQPVFSYGLLDSVIGHHIRYQRVNDASMVRTLATNHVGYAFDLFLGADVPDHIGFQRVARHQWERYGHTVFTNRPHLAMPFEEYWRLIYHLTFNPVRDPKDPFKLLQVSGGPMDAPLPGYEDHGSWLEWKLNGQPVGGYRSAIPWWNDVLHNSAFWNNAREAAGLHFWGRRMNDPKLIERARRIINLCLAAPRNPHGLFATLYNASSRQWGLGFTDPPHGQNHFFLRDAKSYDVIAMSKTGAHLLDYHLRCEPDPRIVTYLAPYADWLLTAFDERGTVPAFVTDEMQASPIFRDSAHPAASLWFLAEMANATGLPKYREGAARIAAYLEKEILPGARWIDFEQYLSCGAKPFSLLRDEWQQQYFRGNLCLIWAAEGFAALHGATRDTRWLRDGEQCVDYLSFSQCSWEPHFIYTAFPFGGFTVDNSDTATMLDARQAETVKPFLWYGKMLGRQDLLERGVAAARASIVLINHPLHKTNNIYRHTNIYPLGFGPENIDHEAHPQSAMRTHPSWGEGSGVFTGLAEALRGLGGAYVDFEKKIAVGTDGVVLKSYTQEGKRLHIELENHLTKLAQPWPKPFDLELRLTGLPSGRYELIINRGTPRAIEHDGTSRHLVRIGRQGTN